jgi:hypothetical protein
MNQQGVFELGFILLFLGGIFVVWYFYRKSSDFPFRPIPPITNLRRAVHFAVENGNRLHILLGRNVLTSQEGAAEIAGLRLVQEIYTTTALSDAPPVVTSGDAAVSILSRDVIKTIYRAKKEEERFNPTFGYMAGVTPLSYTAGALLEIYQTNTSANILIGGFGGEIGLLADAAEQRDTLGICGAGSISAQAVVCPITQHLLLGEEIYGADVYLHPHVRLGVAGLRMQDVFRWLIVLIILAGIIARITGMI